MTPCTPSDPSCHAATSQCLPVHDYAGAAAFGLRMSHLELSAPAAFTKGIVKNVIQSSVTPNQPACNVQGTATFSWLLAFDTLSGKLTTGGAKPAQNPAIGYSFVNQGYPIIGGTLQVAPVTLDAPVDASCNVASTAVDLNIPIYLDAQGSSAVLLPLRQLTFQNAKVSSDHNCIGAYNAAGLDPANNCLGDAVTPTFLPGGEVSAHIVLEQADAIVIDALTQSLCVLLSGDAAQFGNGGSPNRCKRQNGKIVFQGDWCAATNQPAAGGCADAVRFQGAFAASAVKIN